MPDHGRRLSQDELTNVGGSIILLSDLEAVRELRLSLALAAKKVDLVGQTYYELDPTPPPPKEVQRPWERYAVPAEDPLNRQPGSIWEGFLDQDFSRAFSAFRPRRGSSNYLDFFRRPEEERRAEQDFNQRQNLLAFTGNAPNLTPTDFLDEYDFMRRYQTRSNRQRGFRSASSLNPSLSFNLPR